MNDPIEARLQSPAQALPATKPGELPTLIMWMPGGLHAIQARKGTKTVSVTVQVTPETALIAQAALESYLGAGKQRPFFDFDHDSKSAAAWPLEFIWRDDQPGVWARVEWSQAGREAIVGKTYRSFSPSFFVDSTDGKKPAVVTSVPFTMGGLVNDPAFREMEPIWSARGESTKPSTHMPEKNTELELAAMQSRVAELETQNAELKASATANDHAEEIRAKQTEIAELQRKLDAAENLAAARAKRDAETCVKAAVSRGVIAPQDTTLQAHWTALIEKDPKNADLLNAQRGAPAVQAQRITRPQTHVELITPDTNDVLRGYLACKDPRKRGEIYRKELDPILAKGERIAFERLQGTPIMANSLGTLVSGIISQRTLATLVSMRPMLRDIVTDFSDEQARLGETVTTRAVALPTIQDFGAAPTASTVTDFPVTLNAHKQSYFRFTATEYNSTGRNLVAEHSNALAVGLGNHMVDTVAALITDAFTSETTGAASTKDFSALTTACKALNTAGAPDFDRAGWVNADFAEALSNDEVVTEYLDGGNASAYSRWTNIKGFRSVSEYPALPGNAVNLIGFFFQKAALLMASRVAVNPSQIIGAGYAGTLEVVTDPVTGLSVVNNLWIDQSTLAINARMILLYGCARGLVGAGHKFVTT